MHPAGRTLLGTRLTEIAALPGHLRAELVRCGKPTCRCARGELHGPYLYRRWKAAGRQHKRYVRPEELDDVRAALVMWAALHPSTWSIRQSLAELRRLTAEPDSRGG